ncbi:MAG: hypothetical protein GBAus27B_000406 [Mycoplasmataceae bacterium]|nr:MAG: hypothetical protein GBAus27B_000406 [Mycoplasmataceae bacterium]
MNSLFGVNVDLKPLLEKTTEFTQSQREIIALLKEIKQLNLWHNY